MISAWGASIDPNLAGYYGKIRVVIFGFSNYISESSELKGASK